MPVNLFPRLAWTFIAPWVQDDWRVTPKLTLNLGFRWDFNSPVSEAGDQLNYIFDPTLVNPVSAKVGQQVLGEVVTKGQLTGPTGRVRLVGSGTIARVEASGIKALSANLDYDATIPTGVPENTIGSVEGHITAVEAFGQQIPDVSGKASYDAG